MPVLPQPLPRRPRDAPRPPSPAAARALLAVCGAALLLAGCATRPPPGTLPPAGARPGADGPPAVVPPDLATRPDAVPRIEPLRAGGPNKPYEVFGVRYAPVLADLPLVDAGLASWYGTRFHGRPTANGETYDMFAMTAAHRTLPIPSYVRVRNPANGRQVVVRVNDRGPFVAGRVIDLSYGAAFKLGVLSGVAPVEVRRITHAEIARGADAGAGVATPRDGREPHRAREEAFERLLRELGGPPEP